MGTGDEEETKEPSEHEEEKEMATKEAEESNPSSPPSPSKDICSLLDQKVAQLFYEQISQTV